MLAIEDEGIGRAADLGALFGESGDAGKPGDDMAIASDCWCELGDSTLIHIDLVAVSSFDLDLRIVNTALESLAVFNEDV